MAEPRFLLQDNAYACGAVALHNAMAAMGHDYDPVTLEKLAGTTPTSGTTPDGLIRAVTRLRHPGQVIEQDNAGFALLTLRGILHHGGAACLVVDSGEHWIAAVGLIGPRVVVADSAWGVSSLDSDGLVQRWAGDKPKFWGLGVLPRGRR